MGRRLKNLEKEIVHLKHGVLCHDEQYASLADQYNQLEEKYQNAQSTIKGLQEEIKKLSEKVIDLQGAFDVFKKVSDELTQLQKNQIPIQQMWQEYFNGDL